MADQKISELTALTGANVADDDAIAIVDTSATETKKIVFSELKNALDTATGFVRITGDTMTGNLSMGDNVKAIFGAGSDLQIYHDGNDSIIKESGAGHLRLLGDDIKIRDVNNAEMYIDAVKNGTVGLYYDNSAKLNTTSTGVDITGTLTSDDLQIEAGTSDRGLYWKRSSDNWTNAEIRIEYNANYGGTMVFGTSPTGALTTSNTDRLKISNNGDISFYEDTGTTPKFFWDASAESLGIGTSSPSEKLHVNSGGGNVSALFESTDTLSLITFKDNDTTQTIGVGAQDNDGVFYTAGTERMRIDSSGLVGIGTSSPSSFNGGANNLVVGSGSGSEGITIYADNASNSAVFFADTDSTTTGQLNYQHASNAMTFHTNGGSEAMRIDSSGSLLVGTTSSDDSTDGLKVKSSGQKLTVTRNGAEPLVLNRRTSDGDILKFRKDNTTVGSIGSISGAVSYIVLDPRTNGSGIRGSTASILPTNNAGANLDATIELGSNSNRFKDIYLSNSVKVITATNGTSIIDLGDTADSDIGRIAYDNSVNAMYFKTNNSEAMRIISDGTLLVGKTATDSGTVGFEAAQDGHVYVTVNNTLPLYINRQSGDELLRFASNGSTVGSIGTSSSRLHINNGDTGLRFAGDLDAIWPCTTDGGDRDNAIDLGSTGIRFKNLYLSGGVVFGDAGGSGTSSSNTFDSYETGTFTPNLTGTGGAFSGATYGVQSGKYTKVGDTVTVIVHIVASVVVGGSGSLAVGNLPFAANSACGASIGYISGLNYDDNTYNQVGLYMTTSGGSRIIFTASGDNVAATEITIGGFTSNFNCVFTATYKTAD